jgi:hypothetical protein
MHDYMNEGSTEEEKSSENKVTDRHGMTKEKKYL